MIGKTLLLVSCSKEHDLAVMTEAYLDLLGAEILVAKTSGEAIAFLRARPEIGAVIVIGEAALKSTEILRWLRLSRPHLPCCVLGTERRHLAACAVASGHFLIREDSPLEVGRLAAFLRDQLDH